MEGPRSCTVLFELIFSCIIEWVMLGVSNFLSLMGIK